MKAEYKAPSHKQHVQLFQRLCFSDPRNIDLSVFEAFLHGALLKDLPDPLSLIAEYMERSQGEHPHRISAEQVQRFLENPNTAASHLAGDSDCAIDITAHVEMLIRAGVHQVAGISASVYARKWPKVVALPQGYAGRFDHVLLIDETFPLEPILKRLGQNCILERETAVDVVSATDASGVRPPRYVVFFHDRDQYLSLSAEDACEQAPEDAVAMTLRDGVFLALQHPFTFGTPTLGDTNSGAIFPGTVFGKGERCVEAFCFIGEFTFASVAKDEPKKFSAPMFRGATIVPVP
ncbi:MAG: hypothetical protein ABIH21_03955 [Patescibacteria group bacterium]